MDGEFILQIAKAVLSLALVIGLMGVFGLFLKKYAQGEIFSKPKEKTDRLGIIQMKIIDPKRRLLLIKRDDQEHLIMTGPTQDIVIERNIVNNTSIDAVNTKE